MARTYLERHLEEFEDASRDDLIRHGLLALKESMSQDKELTIENTSIGVIGTVTQGSRKGKVETFKLYDGPDVGPMLEAAQETAEETMDVDS
jgi:20S proteasome subunit alpha 6